MLTIESARVKHAAALHAAEAILAAANNRPLNDQEQAAFDAAMKQAGDLEAAVERLQGPERVNQALATLTAGAARTPGGLILRPAQQSLGSELLASEIGNFLRTTKGTRSGAWRSPSVELMAATLTSDPASGGALVLPQTLPTIVPTVLRPTTVLDLLASGTTNSNAVNSLTETSYVNAAAATAEGAVKPESTLTFAAISDPVRKIAHWLPVTDELLDDEPALGSYIDQRLRAGVNVSLDGELLNGSGVAPHILGILARPGLAPPKPQGAGSPLDAIASQISAIEVATNLTVDGLVFNPADWIKLQTMKTTTNEYLSGSPFVAAPNTLWGRAVATDHGARRGQCPRGVLPDSRNGVFARRPGGRGVRVPC